MFFKLCSFVSSWRKNIAGQKYYSQNIKKPMSEFQNTLLSILLYILNSILLTLKIIFSVFFPIIIACIILNVLSREQNKRLLNIGGWKALFITAWIGTPVHELSHYLAAVIANHKIIDLKLFKPNKRTGSMGYLTHSYKENDLYQAVFGNTIIAIAPFFGGAAVIYLFSTIVFPDFSLFTRNVPELYYFNFNNVTDWNTYSLVLNSHLKFFGFLIEKIFSIEMIGDWKLYIFLFLMFGIANHISPSGSDFENFWQPVTILLFIIILLSLITYPLIKNSEIIIETISKYIFVFVPILYLAIFISLMWLILTYIIYFLVVLFR